MHTWRDAQAWHFLAGHRAGRLPAGAHGLASGELTKWLIAVIIVAVILGIAVRVLSAVLRRQRYGPRRPWLSLWLRLRFHLNPGPGFASDWEVWRRHGLPEARRIARHARPSLSWLDRRVGSWREYAAFVGWAQGWVRRQRVYASLESLRLVIAAPQEGKSAEAAGTILDAPGPVVATSIRGDLIAATAGLRAGRGKVDTWNPEGIGDYGSTIQPDLIEGCQDMATAVRRAGHMVEATTARGLSDDGFWSDQASMVLAAYLHAAGLAGGDLRHVYQWVMEGSDQPRLILAAHPGAAGTALSQVIQYLSLPDRTRAGISTTINSCLKFMQDPVIVAGLCPPPGAAFSFEEFLQGDNTLYLVASDAQHSPVPPLFVVLLAELTYVARQVGAVRRPARPPRRTLLGSAVLARLWNQAFPARAVARLDPPLTLVLDEVANIAPVPVAAWATWAAGSGIWLHLYAQAWAQLVERWGQHGAAVIWQACKCKVIYTATSEPDLCQMVEDLCGTVRLRGPDDWRYTRHGKPRRRPTSEVVPVLPMATVRQLPAGRAVVIQGHAPPTIVRTEQVRRRADYRSWLRRGEPVLLPRPPERVTAEPMPVLLTPANPPRPPLRPAELAGRRDRWPGPGPGGPPTRPLGPGPDADGPDGAAPELPPGRPPRLPRPPSRPAPWDRAGGGEPDE